MPPANCTVGRKARVCGLAIWTFIWTTAYYLFSSVLFVAVSIDRFRLIDLFKHSVVDRDYKLVDSPLVREQELLHTSAVFLFSAGLVANFLSGSPYNDPKEQPEERWHFQALWGITMLLTLSALLCSFAARTGIFQLWSMTRDYLKHLRECTDLVWLRKAQKQPLFLVKAKVEVCHRKSRLDRRLHGNTVPQGSIRSTQSHSSQSASADGPATEGNRATITDSASLPENHPMYQSIMGLTPKYRKQVCKAVGGDEFKSQVLQYMYWEHMGPSVRCAIRILGIFLFFSRFCFGCSLCLWLATIQYAVVALGGAWARTVAGPWSADGGWAVFVAVILMESVAVGTLLSFMTLAWQMYNKYHDRSKADGNVKRNLVAKLAFFVQAHIPNVEPDIPQVWEDLSMALASGATTASGCGPDISITGERYWSASSTAPVPDSESPAVLPANGSRAASLAPTGPYTSQQSEHQV